MTQRDERTNGGKQDIKPRATRETITHLRMGSGQDFQPPSILAQATSK